MEEQLHLTQEWDKTFPQNSSVEHRKVTFHNRYGITLAADLYRPKGAAGPLPALAVCGPFGAVKEQASGLRPLRPGNGPPRLFDHFDKMESFFRQYLV